MAKDEYELLPKDDIEDLKKEINKLKRGGMEEFNAESYNTIPAIDKLNDSINSLVELFKTAKDSMEVEERESELIAKKLDPLYEKVDMLIEQNKKIAQGIIAVADMVKEYQMLVVKRPDYNAGNTLSNRVPKPNSVPSNNFNSPTRGVTNSNTQDSSSVGINQRSSGTGNDFSVQGDFGMQDMSQQENLRQNPLPNAPISSNSQMPRPNQGMPSMPNFNNQPPSARPPTMPPSARPPTMPPSSSSGGVPKMPSNLPPLGNMPPQAMPPPPPAPKKKSFFG